MKQMSLGESGFERKTKRTRKREFLDEMNLVVPWAELVSLIAPRPVLFLTGELDAGSPTDGIKVIEAKAGGVYKAVGADERFRSVRYGDIGHTYTPAMRKEMLAWFDRWLR